MGVVILLLHDQFSKKKEGILNNYRLNKNQYYFILLFILKKLMTDEHTWSPIVKIVGLTSPVRTKVAFPQLLAKALISASAKSFDLFILEGLHSIDHL